MEQNNDRKLKEAVDDVEIEMEALKDDFGALVRAKIKNLRVKNLYVTINNYPPGFLDDPAGETKGDENLE